jgi:hypothetical protein
MTSKSPIIAAAIEGEGTRATLVNKTGHRVTFWIQGTIPHVGLTLDGNSVYPTYIVRDPNSATIVIRLDGPEGQILATWPATKEDSNG